MDTGRVDTLTRQLAQSPSRRRVLQGLGGGLMASLLATAALGIAGLHPAGAQNAPPAATPGASPSARCPVTTAAENAALARRWTQDVVSGHDLAVLDEIAAPDIVWDPGAFPTVHGRAAVMTAFRRVLTAFPDVRVTDNQVIAEHDLVAVRFTAAGTHRGPLHGVPGTGKHVVYTGINIYRIACGQITAGWSEADALAQLQQIGALPALPATPAATPAMGATPAANCASTSVAANEAVVRRSFAAWSAGDVAAFAEVLAPQAVHHWGLGADTTGVAAYQQKAGAFFAAFPDLAVTLDLLFGQGDLVAARWTATGTHRGAFLGLAPTGRTVTWTGNNIFRLACGKIAESWDETDGLGLWQRLGARLAVTPGAGTPVPDGVAALTFLTPWWR